MRCVLKTYALSNSVKLLFRRYSIAELLSPTSKKTDTENERNEDSPVSTGTYII